MATTLKEKILTKAEHLFWMHGFNNTSVNDVVEAAGVSKGAFFHHYPTKNALGQAVIRHYFTANILQPLDKAFADKNKMPKQQLIEYIWLMHNHTKAWDFRGGCLLGNFALEVTDVDAAMRADLNALWAEWQDTLLIKLHPLVQANRISIPPQQLVNILISSIEGIIMAAKVHKDGERCKADFDGLINIVHHFVK
jgi:TetR/AcrR family transcriptional repressor of nem operon